MNKWGSSQKIIKVAVSNNKRTYFGKLKFTNKEALKKLSRVQLWKTSALRKIEINKRNSKNYLESLI